MRGYSWVVFELLRRPYLRDHNAALDLLSIVTPLKDRIQSDEQMTLF